MNALGAHAPLPAVLEPNVLGIATWADGGEMMTKPYAASGRYVDRMSTHCSQCRYDPRKRVGDDACPFTTLYWDFLSRNRRPLEANRRMGPVLGHLDRIDAGERHAIAQRAAPRRCASASTREHVGISQPGRTLHRSRTRATVDGPRKRRARPSHVV